MLERVIRALPAVAWMSFIFAMSSREQFPEPFGLSTFLLSIGAHLVLYGTLAILLLIAIVRNGNSTHTERLAAIVGAVLYGVSDEIHQSFVPGRDASLFDLGVNTVGAVVAVTTWTYLRSVLPAGTSR